MILGPDAYRCVACLGELQAPAGQAWRCTNCARRFPVVGGLPILTPRPRALAVICQLGLEQTGQELARSRAALDRTRNGLHVAFTARAQRVLRAREQNLELVRAYMAPIEAYLRAEPHETLNTLDWIAAHTGGWRPQAMLPYFYQDWGSTTEFQATRRLLLDALIAHRPDAQTVAILGAGACGLVHAAAPLFAHTFALDLSWPTLLIARGLLDGRAIVVHLERAHWCAARLVAAPVVRPVHLVVSDAAVLPFADGSLSAVVTQYVMDVVGNPLAVIDEIHRTLRPGGAWINFSTPFSLPAEPPEFGTPSLEEVAGLLETFGFELRERERRRFTPIDLTALDPYTKATREEVHFFVARRAPTRVARTNDREALRSADGTDHWWEATPFLMPGRRTRIRCGSVSPTGQPEPSEIELAGTRVSAPRVVAELLDRVLGLIDGTRSTRDILSTLIARGTSITPEEFRELLTYLDRHYGVIRVGPNLPCDLTVDRVL